MEHIAAILALGLIGLSQGSEQCQKKYSKVGCFQHLTMNDSPLSDLLLTRRDWLDDRYDGILIDWKNYTASLHSLYCKCAELAERNGYAYFGLQYYGECWSGSANASSGIENSFKGESSQCIKGNFEPCSKASDGECIGKGFAKYVYMLQFKKSKQVHHVDGGYTEWSQWSACTKSCGGGFRTRQRSCTNPAPSKNGNDCASIGPTEEVGGCNDEACVEACKQAIDLGIIIDASRSVKKQNFNKIKLAVSVLSHVLEISSQGSHLGIIHYAKFPYVDFTPRDTRYHNSIHCRAKIASIAYTKGGKRIDRALKAAESEFFCKGCSRKGVPQVLLVVTTGKTGRKSEDLGKASLKMKSNGVTILAVGVGKKAKYEQLNKIASKPIAKHVFKFATFDEIKPKIESILSSACVGRAVKTLIN